MDETVRPRIPGRGKEVVMQDTHIIPLPDTLRPLLQRANFSLAFSRLMRWDVDSRTGKFEKPTNEIDNLSTVAKESLHSGISPYLAAIHKRQGRWLDSIREDGAVTISLKARLVSPFISGLGSGHPNETGMILDRNTGCPFLPASSVKGVLRLAYAVNLAAKDPSLIKQEGEHKGEIDDHELRKYFGDTDTRGQLCFLDAYPLDTPDITTDIMNPHYGKYYMQTEPRYPVETESPVPVKFLAVESGCEFVFRLFILPPASLADSDIAEIHAMFTTAFSRIGFGGKTAIGYGRFREIQGD
jgi:CRISPR-associated protein Cmr6